MNMMVAPSAVTTDRPICIAVLAMGGQGGGVLVDWIVQLAESQGWIAQSTSVPGVAQRTGATIYYAEIIRAREDGAYPILALMPEPGEVDIVVGAELMEAGRAMQRGLVTPDRTTLIASSHRSYAIQEKQVPGDGIAHAEAVYTAAATAAKRFIAFDMAALAEQTGSAISAVMFGGLAASGTLPFARSAYEETIRAVGVGVAPSLRAFAAGYDVVTAQLALGGIPPLPPSLSENKVRPELMPLGHEGFDALVERARTQFPASARGMIAAGLQRVVDFQDVAYGGEYLDLLARFLPVEREGGADLITAVAKYAAIAMAYDDVIRIADLKTRASRFDRVRGEMQAKPDQLVDVTEFMHPRMEEVLGTFPARLGAWTESRPRLVKFLDRFVNRGRRVRTTSVLWFLPLYALASVRPLRRGTLRHRRETEHRNAWIELALDVAQRDHALAVAIIEARRLVKGYSDTHARGLSKFDRVMTTARRLDGRGDAAEWVKRLQKAALADETGDALAGALATVDSFLQ